jgi:hypothetical protein
MEEKEEELLEMIKPFLQLKIEQITAIEISPCANYFVLVYGNKVLIARITPHQELANLTLPIYMIKSISYYSETPP